MKHVRSLGALALCTAALFVAGCSSGPSLVGKWNATGIKGIPAGSTVVMDFKADTVTTDATISQAGMTIKVKSEATYKIEGTKLSMTTTKSSVDEASLPAAIKPMLPMIKAEMEKQNGQVASGELKITGDTATIEDPKTGNITLTKVK
jgi:hypothetical protein